ncbi:hypothetical protein AYI70_g12117 [Smittium culicis]|uniref:Uncharacterized protein n=1 Tax=Smittium culicis TaxID=133412 RepID=A0A1R1WYS2_9FUNG|nr:hypothetical protein AYI70_g12117 [Smittium culicis]
MVIRKPVKRARSLFSDIVKGDDPQYATKAELTSTIVNSTSVFNQSKLNTQYLNQKTPKKIQIQQSQKKKTTSATEDAGKLANTVNMMGTANRSAQH